MDKTKLWWWLGFFVLLMIAVAWHGSQNAIVCWDGIEVDQALLMESCGITQEEYFENYALLDECPAGYNAIQPIGGCETDWTAVWGMLLGTAIGFMMSSGMVYLAWLMMKKIRST